jgi:peptidoglycan/LPS O-acetylase OafA/YrhL
VRGHVPELDGIRGLAVLLVLVWHYFTCQDAAKLGPAWVEVTKTTYLFWTGVDLFFVLSGYLIGGILWENHRHPGFYRAFYIRRAARILPVYGALLASYFLLQAFLTGPAYHWLFHDPLPNWSLLTFTQNIWMGIRSNFGGHFLGITWSLAVEEQFYLVIPFLLWLLGRQRFPVAVVILAVSAPFLRLVYPGLHAMVGMPFRMDSLLIGVMLGMLMQRPELARGLEEIKGTLVGVLAVLFIGMGAMTRSGAGHGFLDRSAIATFYAVFILVALLYRGSQVTAPLRSVVLTRLGMYSYGLYMYHQMVAGLMHGFFRGESPSIATIPGAWITFSALFLSIALAACSHHTLEAYFRAWGKKYSYEGVSRLESPQEQGIASAFKPSTGAE